MSYCIGAILCPNADHAAQQVIEAWMWGINSAADVAGLDAEEIYLETVADLPTIEAQIVGRFTDEGEQVYEDVTPTPERRREMIEELIAFAKAQIAAEEDHHA